MAIKLLSIMEQFDAETKGTLSTDFIQEVFRKKNYTLTEFINILFYSWIPLWLEEKRESKKSILMLRNKLKDEAFLIL